MQSGNFSGAMTMNFRVVSDSISQIVLDMVELATDSVFVNNAPVLSLQNDTTITIRLMAIIFQMKL